MNHNFINSNGNRQNVIYHMISGNNVKTMCRYVHISQTYINTLQDCIERVIMLNVRITFNVGLMFFVVPNI